LPHDPLLERVPNRDVQALVAPPRGWAPDPPKLTRGHQHQTWISPSGRTAYGVIHFVLPLPVGHDLTLWGFLREMKRTEGESILVSKKWDENLRAVRFVADGGKYRVRTSLFLRGWEGWMVYAGTLRSEPVEQNELALAERAREHTALGLGEVDHRNATATRPE
jgi:hypothetical protein